MGERMMTHSADCWRWHIDCAVARVERLEAENELVEAENEALRDALRLERLEHQDFRKMAMAMDEEIGADTKTIAALRDSLLRARWAHKERRNWARLVGEALMVAKTEVNCQRHTIGRLVGTIANMVDRQQTPYLVSVDEMWKRSYEDNTEAATMVMRELGLHWDDAIKAGELKQKEQTNDRQD